MPKHLLVVESPAKAKTIKRFLGNDYLVEASMGHVRDLPKKELGVDTKKDFSAKYVVPKEKAAVIKHLKAALKKVDNLWIATDEDREGEAIGWHLIEALGISSPEDVKRIVFHEITESAIHEALENPRRLNMQLVDAQQARRILDRLVGYTLSPFLWKKVYRGLSAGRVQSVAVRLIVDREREIKAFDSQEYWTIDAELHTEKQEEYIAQLKSCDGKKFVPKTEEETQKVLNDVDKEKWEVANVETKDIRRNPPPPFTTSTLQQEAARKLGFSVKQTMVVAQQLYEGIDIKGGYGQTGLITYMRTDSVTLSNKALNDAADVIEQQFGREYVLTTPRRYKTKSKGAQEAHEAIRPTELERTPSSLKSVLDSQQWKLYALIWNRTLATQMPSAELKRVGADIAVKNYVFRATGQTVTFDGFFRVYQEGREDYEKEDSKEKFLPQLCAGQIMNCQNLLPEQHFTKPLPRYTEASLVKKLEEEGIGRPSTYAPTIGTIQQRGYIQKEEKQLVPQEVAFTVTDLLVEHFPNIVDIQFTAGMEESLDAIAEGKQQSAVFLRQFYEPFEKRIAQKEKEVNKDDVMKERVLGEDPTTKLPVIVRMGRFGPYVQLGEFDKTKKQKEQNLKTASLPKNLSLDSVTLEQVLSLFSFPRSLGKHDDTEITLSLGRFGPYLRWGKSTAALPKEADPVSFSKKEAIELLEQAQKDRKRATEPIKTFDKDPNSKKEIRLMNGRFGPYVTDGKTNASLGKKLDPKDIDFEKAVELLEKKRKKGPSRQWRKK